MAPNNALYIKEQGRVFFGADGAAGSIILSQKTGRLMLGCRSQNVTEPGTWGTYGGAIETGSNPVRAAHDELFEETGYDERKLRLEPLSIYQSPGGAFQYHNHIAIVEDEFTPWTSHENTESRWFEFGDWPDPLHFGMEHILSDAEAVDKLADFVRRAKSGEDLLRDIKEPERTLYHCMYMEPQGEALRAGCRREVKGRESSFLFATPYFTKSLAFGFSYHGEDEIFCNGDITGTPYEFAVIGKRDEAFSKERDIRVLAFSSYGFEHAWKGGRQYVSELEMPFSKTRCVFEARCVEDLMQEGLQVFSSDKTFREMEAMNLYDIDAQSNVDWLCELTRRGFTWENDALGIHRAPILQQKFGEMEKRSYLNLPAPNKPQP